MGIRYSALCDIGRQRETNQDSVYAGSRLPAVADGWGSRTRAYLLRGGELFQITHDHTVVQSLLDEGRITPEEAISHPQRSLLLRGIDGTQVTADTSLHDACVGDRYLLCSDGLTAVVATREIEHTPRGRQPGPDGPAACCPGQSRWWAGQYRLRGR